MRLADAFHHEHPVRILAGKHQHDPDLFANRGEGGKSLIVTDQTCGKTKHSEMLALQEHVVKTKTAVQNHPAAKAKQESIIDRAISALKDLFIRAISYDPIALMKERKAVRADIELKGTETIEKAIGKKHSFRIYLQSKEKADEIVDGVEREQKEQKPRGKEKPLHTKDTERIA